VDDTTEPYRGAAAHVGLDEGKDQVDVPARDLAEQPRAVKSFVHRPVYFLRNSL
jgi:hypothetical protein